MNSEFAENDDEDDDDWEDFNVRVKRKAEKSEEGKSMKSEKIEKGTKSEKNEKSTKSEKNEKSMKSEKNEESKKNEKSEKSEKNEKPESEKTKNSQKSDKTKTCKSSKGNCNPVIPDFTCICPPGYYGEFCENGECYSSHVIGTAIEQSHHRMIVTPLKLSSQSWIHVFLIRVRMVEHVLQMVRILCVSALRVGLEKHVVRNSCNS